jgi:hypothetical protein
MMDLRKFLSLGFATLMVVAFSSSAFAQVVANPPGIWIRVTSPDSGKFAKIDDTVRVNVLTLGNVINTLYLGAVTDTTATQGDIATVAALTAGRNTVNTDKVIRGYTEVGTNRTVFTGTSGTAVDTFKVKWGISTSDVQFTADTGAKLSLVLWAKLNDTTNYGTGYYKLSNLYTDRQIQSSLTTKVGDGKRFSIDGKRPVSSTVLSAVVLDTINPYVHGLLAVGTLPRNLKAFGIGQKIALSLTINTANVLGANVKQAKVIIIDSGQATNTTAVLDSAIYTTTITNLFNSPALDTFTVAAGDFGDLKQVVAAAFLEDAAGNLSGTATTAATPEPLTSNIFYALDATAPAITPIIPNIDSGFVRYTGAIDTTYQVRSRTSGADSTITYTFKPLQFKVQLTEQLTSIKWVVASTDSATNTDGPGTALTLTNAPTANGIKINTNKAQSPATLTTQGGVSGDLRLTIIDKVGNTTNQTLAGLTYDRKVPGFTRLFPTKSNAPKNEDNSNKPTINAATYSPQVRLNEALDSLAVIYVQVGGNPPDVAVQQWSNTSSSIAKTAEDIVLSVADTLMDQTDYTLQIYQKDKNGNVSVTKPDTLTYTKAFNNPVADSFVVTTTLNDSVLAGQAMELNLAAIDTSLTFTQKTNVLAVTYKGGAKLQLNVSTAEASKLSGVTFEGTGVSIAASDTGKGIATLDSDGWVIGERTIKLKSNWTLEKFSVSLVDNATSFDGILDSLWVDASDMRKYVVTAMEEGTETSAVGGDFQVHVVATDEFGNPSMKAWKVGTNTLASMPCTAADSLKLLDSRLYDSKTNSTAKYVLKELFVELSANAADAKVPPGPQAFDGDATFTAVAPDRTGEGLVISVRTHNAQADTSGFDVDNAKQLLAAGNTTALSFVPFGEEVVVTPTGAPAAPDTLIVQDYKGADGKGDQGGFIVVSFPQSENHATVSQYRIYREMMVSTGLDADGKLVALTTPVKKYVPWTVVDAVPTPAEAASDSVVRAVVPTLDNVATLWAVTSESGTKTSERTVAAKRVFTKESVQQMVNLLGVDPNRVLTSEELIKQFNAPKDYVKSLLGDQKNLTFAALDPDLNSLLGTTTVPTSIRTEGAKIIGSARTVSAAAVAAMDNIPPAAVTEAAGAKSTDRVGLTWKASADDKIVAFSTYRGMSIPIAGVDQYKVLRGTTEENLALLTSLPAGTSSFTDTNLPQAVTSLVYRVDALDLDNTTQGSAITVRITAGRQKFVGADGLPVYIVDLTATPTVQDFNDFIAFAQSYLLETDQAGFNVQADTNDDGIVNFTDFINFAQRYQQEAVGGPVAKLVSVPKNPGVNSNAEMSLSLTSDRVLVGETVSVDVSLANTEALYGYGLTLTFDPDKFELVDAVPAEGDMLKASGGETPLFLKHTEGTGQVTLMNAVINGEAVSGDGSIVTLTFKVLREFEDNARFEIAEGLVFDPNQLSNPVVTLGALNVETTPTEFALLQNYPNPFNPETTIKYNLAETANVQLRIYNIVGQVVKTLVGDRQAAGRYQVRWNGTDDRGVAVSSGIYFYQISAGKFQDVKRLMLLK